MRKLLRRQVVEDGAMEECKAELKEITKQCRRLRRRTEDERRIALAEEIDEAWRSGRPAVAQRLARQLAGNGVGPKKRDRPALTKVKPTSQERADFWKLPGPEGGMSAVLTTWEEMRSEHFGGLLELPTWEPRHGVQAEEDLQAVRSYLRKAPKRRAGPSWAISLRWSCTGCCYTPTGE